MHTARQLDEKLFEVALANIPATRADLLADWGPLDRFGVVIHEGFGSVGCSYLLQLAISAFYDIRPERRDHSRPVYPDVFAFHVGGAFGDHGFFDVYPPRKEVFVANEPAAILNAINDRGITHLAVPDRAPDHVQHEYKEPRQALDRISRAWAYSPDGRTSNPDVVITAVRTLAEANTRISLDPKGSYQEQQLAQQATGAIVVPDEEMLRPAASRTDEVPEQRRHDISQARTQLDGPAGRSETYRRIEVADALRMLHIGPAPAFA